MNGSQADLDRRDRLCALIARQPVVDHELTGTALGLQRLCGAAVRVLPASGAAVSLMADHGPSGIVASSDAMSAEIEELQFLLGEGPCWDAFEFLTPVLVADMRRDGGERWPGYSTAAGERSVRAAFAFPLHVGSSRLGVLGIFRDRPGALSARALADAVTFGEIATTALLDGQASAHAGAAAAGVEDALQPSFVVYQAQGMVMIQLSVPLIEAMSRLRAYAYTHDRSLGSVARDIVARTLILEKDGT